MTCRLDRLGPPNLSNFGLVSGPFHSSDRHVDLSSATVAALTPLLALCEATFAVLALQVAHPRPLLLPQTLKNMCFP